MSKSGKFEGSDLSIGHGEDRFGTSTGRVTEEALQSAPLTPPDVSEKLTVGQVGAFVQKELFQDLFTEPFRENVMPAVAFVYPLQILSLKDGGSYSTGDYTLNPDMRSIDLPRAVFDYIETDDPFSPTDQVLQGIDKDRYYLPGIEYAKGLNEKVVDIPFAFYKGTYLLPGSAIYHKQWGWFFVQFWWDTNQQKFKFQRIDTQSRLGSSAKVVVMRKP